MDKHGTRGLIRRAQKGDESARNTLVEMHRGLAAHAARRFYRRGAFMEMDDLLQQGCLGLIKAIAKFNPRRRTRKGPIHFSTYAMYWIHQSIGRAIENHGRTVAVPVYTQYLVRVLENAIRRTRAARAHAWNIRELAHQLGITSSQLKLMEGAVQEMVPLDVLSDELEPRSLLFLSAGIHESPEQRAVEHDRRDHLWALIRTLPPRERYVLQRRYGLARVPWSTQMIARVLRISEERVRKLRERALKRIRSGWAADDGELKPPALPGPPRKRWAPTIA